MQISTMFGDVVASFFRRPATEKYPFERREPPQRLRGHLQWDMENCTGCGLCAQDCPAEAIEMIVIDKKSKRFVLQLWELAALDRESFSVHYGREEDVQTVLGNLSNQDAPSTSKNL